MKKILILLIMIGIVVAFYFYVSNLFADKKNEDVDISEETILTKLDNDYDSFVEQIRGFQENPDQLAELNCTITKLLYSGELKDEEVKLLLTAQREYYAAETLENNPEAIHYERLLENIKSYDFEIIGYKVVGPQFVDVEAGEQPILIFNVIYYLNSTDYGDVYKGYVYQQNTDKLWELKGFGQIDGFETINQ